MEEKIKNLTIILFLLLYAPLSAENRKVDLIEPEAHAILIPGSGTYSKKISTQNKDCLLYTSPSPRDRQKSRMPSSA